MEKFKKEITILIEGEHSKGEPTLTELMNILNIKPKHWWEKNPSWPYGEPCDEVKRHKINKVEIKTLKDL